MKIEVDSDDLLIMGVTIVVIIGLLTVPGCLQEQQKYEDAKKANTHEQ